MGKTVAVLKIIFFKIYICHKNDNKIGSLFDFVYHTHTHTHECMRSFSNHQYIPADLSLGQDMNEQMACIERVGYIIVQRLSRFSSHRYATLGGDNFS